MPRGISPAAASLLGGKARAAFASAVDNHSFWQWGTLQATSTPTAADRAAPSSHCCIQLEESSPLPSYSRLGWPPLCNFRPGAIVHTAWTSERPWLWVGPHHSHGWWHWCPAARSIPTRSSTAAAPPEPAFQSLMLLWLHRHSQLASWSCHTHALFLVFKAAPCMPLPSDQQLCHV